MPAPFHLPGFVIATRQKRSETILAAFPHSTGWKERPCVISTRDMRPTETSHAPAAGVNARGRLNEVGFQLISAGSLRLSRATRYSALRP